MCKSRGIVKSIAAHPLAIIKNDCSEDIFNVK